MYVVKQYKYSVYYCTNIIIIRHLHNIVVARSLLCLSYFLGFGLGATGGRGLLSAPSVDA